MTGFIRCRTGFIFRRTGFIRTADEASLLTNKASRLANETSPFGPYILTKLAPSSLKLSFSPYVFMPKKVDQHHYDVHILLDKIDIVK